MRLGVLLASLVLPLTVFAAGGKSYDVKIDGMTCGSCATKVKDSLAKLEGVDPASVKVVLEKKNAHLSFKNDDPKAVEAVKKAVTDAGFKVTAVDVAK